MSATERKPLAVIAEFAGPNELLAAAEKVRDRGYSRFDCHSPFPIHGMNEAMGISRSPLGFIVGGVALVALGSVAYGLYWITAVDYPFVVSGKPFFSYQAYAPIAFALTVLLSAFAAFFGMFHLNRLPRLFHPLFYAECFAKVSDDGFIVSVEADDPKFSEEQVTAFLTEIGGTNVEVIRQP
jgi:hypothetical protein